MIDGPLSLEVHVFCRNGLWDCRNPTSEGVTRLGWCSRCLNLCTVILGDCGYITTTISIEGEGVLVDGPQRLETLVLSRDGLRNLAIPTCEGVTNLGWSGRSIKLSSIILGNLYILCAIVGIEGKGILIDSPLSLEAHILSRNGLWDCRYPTSEGVTSLGWCSRNLNLCTVILGDCGYITTTISIEGEGVLVDSPQRLEALVLSRDGLRNLAIPTSEGIARLGWSGRSFKLSIEILGDNRCLCTIVRIEGKGILIDGPLSLEVHVFCRNGLWDCRNPTSEGVTRLGWCSRCLNLCTVILGDCGYITTTISIEGEGVLVDSPQRLEALVLSRDGLRNLAIPTSEGIARLGWSGRSFKLSIEILGDNRCLCTIVRIEGKGILIDGPLSLEVHVFCRNGFWDCRYPTGEGVTRLGWCSRSLNLCTIVLGDCGYITTTISIEGEGVLVDGPQRLETLVLSRDGLRNLAIPTCEGVTNLGWSGRSLELGSIILGDNGCLSTIVRIEGKGVLIDGPLSLEAHILCRNGLWDCRYPTGEGVTWFGWSSRSSNCRIIILRYTSHLRTAIRIKGERIFVDGKCTINRHVTRWHGSRNLTPSRESISHLCRKSLWSNRTSKLYRNLLILHSIYHINKVILFGIKSSCQSQILIYRKGIWVLGNIIRPLYEVIAFIRSSSQSCLCSIAIVTTTCYCTHGFIGRCSSDVVVLIDCQIHHEISLFV